MGAKAVELKKCPFCGAPGKILEYFLVKGFYLIGCSGDVNCRGQADYCVPESEIEKEVTKWNTRAR